MEDYNIPDFSAWLSQANRPIRLRLWSQQGTVDDLLLVKHVSGAETICGALEYSLLCLSTRAGLALKQFIAMPAELQLVTASGNLHCVCGIVTGAAEGESDGAVATYQLTIRDALAVLDGRINTRVFRNASELDITRTLLDECRQSNALLARAFDYDVRCSKTYPARELTLQYNESDAAFLRRLWRRRGLAWFIEAGQASSGDAIAPHTLVLFDDPWSLRQNAEGSVRYHRDAGTETADSITAWHAVRTLTPGKVSRRSADYKQAWTMHSAQRGMHSQGPLGDQLAALIEDYRIDAPHAGHDALDYHSLGVVRMQRHEYEAKYFHGESGDRDLYVGQWKAVTGHPELDTHRPQEREFVIIELHVEADNNLPKLLGDRVRRLFALNRWHDGDDGAALEQAALERGARYSNRFTCVRRGIAIVPACDPRGDLPRIDQQSVTVVGPPKSVIHCDELGRVKVRFPGCRPQDHARGAGASDSERDSAWVRVASAWAGDYCGATFLPRVGDEVIVSFLGGDPDKLLITGRVHGGKTAPPAFDGSSRLPYEKYLYGIVTQEAGGRRGNQLRFDDSPGQISAQLASAHGHSQLNLGYLTHPRRDGHGAPRGDGAELRSDEYLALRAAKGILISAWERLNASDKQLARAEYLALIDEGLELFRALGKYAAEHQALALDDQPQQQLQSRLRQWENGANTAPDADAGGAPLIGISAPDGLSFATSAAIVSYAGQNIDSVAQQHLQLSAGQRFNLNAGKGISLFAQHDGIRQIAHYGKFILQSQHDDTEISAASNVRISASDGKIMLMAKEIELVAEDGSFIKIGGGVTIGSNGDINAKAANFVFTGPATMAATLPAFDGAKPDQKFILKYGAASAAPLIAANRAYEIDMSDGGTIKGVSDALGKTAILQRDAMHIAAIRILTDEE